MKLIELKALVEEWALLDDWEETELSIFNSDGDELNGEIDFAANGCEKLVFVEV